MLLARFMYPNIQRYAAGLAVQAFCLGYTEIIQATAPLRCMPDSFTGAVRSSEGGRRPRLVAQRN